MGKRTFIFFVYRYLMLAILMDVVKNVFNDTKMFDICGLNTQKVVFMATGLLMTVCLWECKRNNFNLNSNGNVYVYYFVIIAANTVGKKSLSFFSNDLMVVKIIQTVL